MDRPKDVILGEAMRCYFLRNNRIEGVELLRPGPDEALIEQAQSLFQARAGENYDGFEVWVSRRFVHRSSNATGTNGKP